jgi:hypothetical protein
MLRLSIWSFTQNCPFYSLVYPLCLLGRVSPWDVPVICVSLMMVFEQNGLMMPRSRLMSKEKQNYIVRKQERSSSCELAPMGNEEDESVCKSWMLIR